ncbi:MAG: hypothetical protein AAGF29_08925 [Pseudomonadota bacterium]
MIALEVNDKMDAALVFDRQGALVLIEQLADIIKESSPEHEHMWSDFGFIRDSAKPDSNFTNAKSLTLNYVGDSPEY